MSQTVCRFADVKILTLFLYPRRGTSTRKQSRTPSFPTRPRRRGRGDSTVCSSSAILSDRQYLHAGEAVGVLGQHHGVAVHAHLAEAGSQVVGVIGPAESVYVDLRDVVVLEKKRESPLGLIHLT